MVRAFVAASLLASLSTLALGDVDAAPAPVPTTVGGPGTDQLIVKMADGSTPDMATLAKLAGEPVGLRRRLEHGAWVGKLGRERSEADMRALAARIDALPGVAYAEPDTRLFAAYVPTDPLFSQQWDMGSTYFGANATSAWDVTKGTSDVIVAVIDTGITSHADLAGQTVPGYDFISDINVANDGNLRDSDPSDPGDWISSTDSLTTTFRGCPVGNSSWHGTHVSGTIAAKQDNGIGVSGIAPNVKVEPVRVLGKCGGYTSDIVDGMRWAAGLAVAGVPANPNPASVLSLSLGGSGSCGATQQQAINDIVAVGATVVVAAGNSNADASGFNPANCANVITVAATGSTGNRAYYSNYGTSVEIAAQGGDANLTPGRILSTLNAGTTTPTTDTYAGYQGTSMATPHVSAAVALLKSVNPWLTPAQLLSALQTNAQAFPAGSTCTTALCGAGILDVGAAVTATASASPTRTLGAFTTSSPAPGATAQGTSLTLSWSASSGATGYEYCLVAGLGTTCTWTGVGTATSVSVSGLAGGTVYSWQVRSTDGTNTAPSNAGVRATFTTAAAVALPGAFAKSSPANAATLTTTTSASLSWAASTGAASYAYCLDTVVNNNCDGTWVSTGTGRTVSITGLTPTTTYEWQVRATNTGGSTLANAGTSWTFRTATPPLPGAFAKSSPKNGATLTSSTSASLSWAASSNATSYEYCVDTIDNGVCDTSWVSTGTARSATKSGLTTKSTYYWQVRAKNAVGTTDANSGTWWRFVTK